MQYCGILCMRHGTYLEYCDAYRLSFTHKEKLEIWEYYIITLHVYNIVINGVEKIEDSKTYYKLTLDET